MNEHVVTLSKEGRLLIPAQIRSQLGLKAGEPLALSVVGNELHVASRRSAIRGMQQRLARLRDPARPVVDELLRERRSAADQE